MNLQDKIDDLYGLFETIKREIKRLDPQQYEQWKAGGFLVDQGIMSMYPCLADLGELDQDTEGEGGVNGKD